uniref:Uncharacterized protein n=1 Tax=Rhizophora mucronata TaxID=61149 RepID=A0A2P2MBF0_RHIMU
MTSCCWLRRRGVRVGKRERERENLTNSSQFDDHNLSTKKDQKKGKAESLIE